MKKALAKGLIVLMVGGSALASIPKQEAKEKPLIENVFKKKYISINIPGAPDSLCYDDLAFFPDTMKTFVDVVIPGHLEFGLYDCKGKIVEEILNEEKEPGRHWVKYIFKDTLSIGIYYFRLDFEDVPYPGIIVGKR